MANVFQPLFRASGNANASSYGDMLMQKARQLKDISISLKNLREAGLTDQERDSVRANILGSFFPGLGRQQNNDIDR